MVKVLCTNQFINVGNIFQDRLQQLNYCLKKTKIDGNILEFGVWKGSTINTIAEAVPNKVVFGFDSFKGLPEKWVRTSNGKRFSEKGEFALSAYPSVKKNVNLVQGWFEESLPIWKNRNPNPVSFLHIDSDLYSSARTILWELNNQIVPGTIIVFDELCDWNNAGIYDLWEEGEWRALIEWMQTQHRSVIPISRTIWLEGALIVTQ